MMLSAVCKHDVFGGPLVSVSDDDPLTEEFSLQACLCLFVNPVVKAVVTTQAQAIIVPSIAFLDKTEKWFLVLFLEKLPGDPLKFLPQAKSNGTFQVT